MPHSLGNMADNHREGAKIYYAKSRKTKKGHSRQPRGSAWQSCTSPFRSTTPPGSVVNRRDSPQTLSSSWQSNSEIDFDFVGLDEHHEEGFGMLGQSPPRGISTLRSTTGTQLAPAPASLPRPPSSWTIADEEEIPVAVKISDILDHSGSILGNQLKMLLKVQG